MERPVEDAIWEEALAAETQDDAGPPASGKALAGLLPWQRFVLALLLFLDVTIVGFLLLLVLGRFQLR